MVVALIVAVPRRIGRPSPVPTCSQPPSDHGHQVLLARPGPVKGQHGRHPLRERVRVGSTIDACGPPGVLACSAAMMIFLSLGSTNTGLAAVAWMALRGYPRWRGSSVWPPLTTLSTPRSVNRLLDTVARCDRYKAVFLVRVNRFVWEGRLALRLQIDQLVVVAVLYLHVVDLHVGGYIPASAPPGWRCPARRRGRDPEVTSIVHHHNAVADRFENASARAGRHRGFPC